MNILVIVDVQVDPPPARCLPLGSQPWPHPEANVALPTVRSHTDPDTVVHPGSTIKYLDTIAG